MGINTTMSHPASSRDTDESATTCEDKAMQVTGTPENWRMATLGEIADIKSGATPSTGNSAYWNGSIPWCTPTDITNTSGKYLFATERSITADGLNSCGASLLPAGALLLCSRATIGEVKIARSPTCTNQGFKSLVSREEVFNEFLYYLVITLKPKMIDLATGSIFLEIGKHHLTSIKVRLPSRGEQCTIAEALSNVDGLLESLEALIAKKQAIKQATIQQLLTGKIRLPGFSGKWKRRRLGDIFSIHSGFSKRQYIEDGGNYFIVDMGSVSSDGRLIASKKTNYSRDSLLKRGDLVMPKDDIGNGKIIGKVAYIDADNLYILGDHIYVLQLTHGHSVFFSYLINYHEVNSSLRSKASGSAQLGLARKTVRDQAIVVPTSEEQFAIATVLSDMDVEIAALEQRRDKTRVVKQGMMQQLLTGKIRLVESVETTTRQVSTASTEKKHNWQFNEAVVISVLARHFGSEKYPLSRMRYTKLSYLLHRYAEGRAEGYLKKAAGPYNPRTRYCGPEAIALKNGYVRRHENGDYGGFIAGKSIKKAESYFAKWYEEDSLSWLDQFRYEKRDDLELLTTVDLAIEELREAGKAISVEGVRKVIHSDPEWKAKLNRSVFSNTNIARAIEKCRRLFGIGDEGSKA